MQITTLTAPDISCDGCAASIKKALARVPGVGEVQVDVAAKTVAVRHEDTTARAAIVDALDRAGYSAC